MMSVGHVLDHVPDHVLDHMIIGLVTTALQYRQGLKITVELISHRFQCQIHVITFDVGFNIVPQGWLKVFLRQQLLSLFNTKMAS